MSIGHVVGLLRSGTTISGGTLSAFEQRAFVIVGKPALGVFAKEQRAYVIVGKPALGVSAKEQRAYVVVGATKDGISVSDSRVFPVIGIPASGVLGVAQQRVYAIVYP